MRISGGKVTVEVDVPGSPNGLAIGPDGALYICNSGGFSWETSPDGFLRSMGKPEGFVGGSIDRYDFKTKKLTTLYSHCGDKRLVGPNDLVFDRDGGLWFSDLGTMAGRVDLLQRLLLPHRRQLHHRGGRAVLWRQRHRTVAR